MHTTYSLFGKNFTTQLTPFCTNKREYPCRISGNALLEAAKEHPKGPSIKCVDNHFYGEFENEKKKGQEENLPSGVEI